PADNLRALWPERSPTMEIFENRVFFPPVKQDTCNGHVETVLLDSSGARSCRRFQHETFRICDVFSVQRGLRQDEVAGGDGVAGPGIFAEQFLRIAGIEPQFPRTRLDAIRDEDKSECKADAYGSPRTPRRVECRKHRYRRCQNSPAPKPVRRGRGGR